MRVTVILPTAGLGTRMGRSRKQFMQLNGSPIFLCTVRKFVASDRVTDVIIAVRPEDKPWVEEIVGAEKFAKPVRVVEGGDSRQQSVENGLAAVDPATDLVAVHDAVRPFIDAGAIARVIDEAALSGAAIVGIVPVDTVKQVGKMHGDKAKIRATIPRDHLVMAQTPQVFRYELLKRAFEQARADGFTGTDEASLVERLDEVEVSVVLGSDRNLKITKPADMELAQLLAQQENARP